MLCDINCQMWDHIVFICCWLRQLRFPFEYHGAHCRRCHPHRGSVLLCVCAKNEKSKSFFTHPRNCRVELLSFGVRCVCVCARVVFSTFYGLKEAQCVSFASNFHLVLFRFGFFLSSRAPCACASVRFKTLRIDFVDSQIFFIARISIVSDVDNKIILFIPRLRTEMEYSITMHSHCGLTVNPRIRNGTVFHFQPLNFKTVHFVSLKTDSISQNLEWILWPRA